MEKTFVADAASLTFSTAAVFAAAVAEDDAALVLLAWCLRWQDDEDLCESATTSDAKRRARRESLEGVRMSTCGMKRGGGYQGGGEETGRRYRERDESGKERRQGSGREAGFKLRISKWRTPQEATASRSLSL